MKPIVSSIIPAGCLAGALLVGITVSGSAGGEGLEAPAPIARAQGKGPGAKCSERTVKGRYAFALQGTVAVVGPLAASGTTTFDGNGFANITGFINTTTGAPAIEASIDGTYTVDPHDCTGSATFSIPAPGFFDRFTELRFEGVIVDRGEEIRYLITTPGVVFAGNSVRQLVMTKVGHAKPG
jgi:hypothetical protein